MTKVAHQDLIKRLKDTPILDLLYNLVEAKTGRPVDILSKVPAPIVIRAEDALERLIAFCRTIDDQS